MSGGARSRARRVLRNTSISSSGFSTRSRRRTPSCDIDQLMRLSIDAHNQFPSTFFLLRSDEQHCKPCCFSACEVWTPTALVEPATTTWEFLAEPFSFLFENDGSKSTSSFAANSPRGAYVHRIQLLYISPVILSTCSPRVQMPAYRRVAALSTTLKGAGDLAQGLRVKQCFPPTARPY